MARLVTDWICVATAGKTVDGREIKEKWLLDAAETYDTQVYTALIWPRHDSAHERQYSYNYGTVEALKTEKIDGKTKLFARLMPNNWLLETNRNDQKLFTSVELATNFAKTGRDYLTGICVTDVPASLGTDRLAFSIGDERSQISQGAPEEFTIGKLMEEQKTEKTLFQRMFSRAIHEDDMSKEDLNKLLESQQQQVAAITELVTTVKEFTTKSQEPEQETKPEPESEENEAHNFSALIAAQKETQATLAELAKSFSALQKTTVTPTPSIAPGCEEAGIFI